MMKKVILLLAGLILIQPELRAQTVNIDFGNLHVFNRVVEPTTVVSGTGTLGTSMAGRDYIWACVDKTASDPSGLTLTYDVGTTHTVLNGGAWDTAISGSSARTSILAAVKNMYYNYETQILNDTLLGGTSTSVNEAGSAFQWAIWHITKNYTDGFLTGALDMTKIDFIIALMQPSALETAMLESALSTTASAGKAVYYADSVTSGYQSLALFPLPVAIPEPGSTGLLVLAVLAAGCHRRRK